MIILKFITTQFDNFGIQLPMQVSKRVITYQIIQIRITCDQVTHIE